MGLKQRDSQYIGFLNKKELDLTQIKEKIANAEGLEKELQKNILGDLERIVSNQEIEWIANNDESKLIDYLVFRYKFKNYPRQRKPTPFPLHLLIEPTPTCNIKCTMCFQQDEFFKEKENIGKIDLDFFKNLIDQAVENNCKALTMASRGEPLLNPDLGEMLNYCKDKFLELKLNTNATILNEKMSKVILDARVDLLVFSVDAGSPEEYSKIRKGAKFETVVENIERFGKIKNSKKEYNKTVTRISGIDMGTQDKEKFQEFWKNKVDSLSITKPIPRDATYSNKKSLSETPCNLLWERMYVWFDGKCNPCDSDYKSTLQMGNAKDTPLKEIWQGEKYNQLRELHLKGNRSEKQPCDQCYQF